MTDNHPLELALPTLTKLGATVPVDLDAGRIAADWFSRFTFAVQSNDIDAVCDLIVDDAYWRDLLALTWDFRTFKGRSRIRPFLADRLSRSQMSKFKLRDDYVQLQQPFPDLAWIQGYYEFETSVGIGSGIFRLVPDSTGQWRAHCMFTNLEDLKNHPERIGDLRNAEPNHGKWEDQRRVESQFANSDPTVLVVGGGQSGLEIGARLKSLGVSCLLIEKNARVGDNWRNRYDALCLHDPVFAHRPPFSFPPSWPVFTPAKKLANWLESYADAMEIDIWTSARVVSASQDASDMWHVTVKRDDGHKRVFKVKHFILAQGFGGGKGHMPSYPGMILHSLEYKKATDHTGKKVAVIGACTSGHDICVDYVDNGVDVTMIQRGPTYVISTKRGIPILLGGLYAENGPPIQMADRINASFPMHFTSGIARRTARLVAEVDKDILDGLRKRGFKLGFGVEDAGFLLSAFEKAGGYYLDVGGSQYIIDGRIKLKNDSNIKEFTEKGLKFENGSELLADVVVFSTGGICGDDVTDRCSPIWGLDEEGEINGCWRDMGVKGLWSMMGNLAYCRFHSKHVALQIKAMEVGVFDGRYPKA
ncbi:FAD/NAD-P-binding domain-containing protein [Infundibulicybe gibba]|nr:FAD/NAD-P-binding domain-containing protein [Infundibulicybe gibba]